MSSDEPENGIGDGNTLDDIVIGSDCRSTQLRVERSADGNGRVYTITLHVQDLAGNRSEATVKVLVPTSTCTTDTAVDHGPRFTVPSPHLSLTRRPPFRDADFCSPGAAAANLSPLPVRAHSSAGRAADF